MILISPVYVLTEPKPVIPMADSRKGIVATASGEARESTKISRPWTAGEYRLTDSRGWRNSFLAAHPLFVANVSRRVYRLTEKDSMARGLPIGAARIEYYEH